MKLLATIALLHLVMIAAIAQGPGRGGRGIPNATPEQTAAVARVNADLAAPVQRLTAARGDLLAAALRQPRDNAAIRAAVDAVRAAGLELASARADAFARLQASSNKLAAEQVPALAAAWNAPGRAGARGTYRTSMPHVTAGQAAALTAMGSELQSRLQALNTARADEVGAVLAAPRNDAAIHAKADAVAAAELALANARADAIARIQSTPESLDAEQLAWFVAAGGSYAVGFTEPEPMNFQDHRGYVPLFDGVSLKGWDGNPKFWRVEGGAIVGESTPANPSGNTYIAYRGVEAKDFTLKFEIKIEGDGGSGFQYRSKTGIPWSRPIPANVTANVGPVNLNWMMTGPQADFWPSQIYSGQFYSENTPMGIMAFRGEVVEGAGLGAKRLMGAIGARTEL